MPSFEGTGDDDIIRPGEVSDEVDVVPPGSVPGAGEDFISGNGGNDTLGGGGGNDIIRGDEGRDRLRGNAGDDLLGGGKRADRLTGGKGDDTLSGDDGRDRLHGGLGSDVLVGGDGDDRFIYGRVEHSEAGAGRDEIFDFQSGDKVDLRRIDADSTDSDGDPFAWIGDSAFSGHAGELRYADGLLQGDVDGDGSADFEIALNGSPNLSADDIFL